MATRAAPVVKCVTSDGRKLTYRRLGNGPVLVCHPGGPGFSSTYFGDLAGLWERFTLIQINPRGTGGSDRPKNPLAYQIDDYVADLEEIRQHLGLNQMMLVGHSHGGVVAQAYAAQYPANLSRLVLASSLARFGPEQDKAMRAGMEKRSGQPWAQDAFAALEAERAGQFESEQELNDLVLREWPLYFAHYGAIEAGYVDTLRTEVINADALKLFNQQIMAAFDLRDRLPNIKAPTLVITGDEDFICGPVCSDDICGGIRDARKVIVGDSGHMVFVEQAQVFHDEVADFLTSA